mgnify:CR=1 FL=1
MMSSPSSEEVNAQRSDFGLRLSNSMAKYGPLCVGIDPHRQLLTDWGYNVDALGAELYSMRMLQAANGRAAAVKFQSSMFERYGSKGIAALDACSMRHGRWVSSPSSTACMAACRPRFPRSRTPISSRARHCWQTPSPCCRITAHGHWEASSMTRSTTAGACSSHR